MLPRGRFAIRKLEAGWSIHRVSAHHGHKSLAATERHYLRSLTEEQMARARSSGDSRFG